MHMYVYVCEGTKFVRYCPFKNEIVKGYMHIGNVQELLGGVIGRYASRPGTPYNDYCRSC